MVESYSSLYSRKNKALKYAINYDSGLKLDYDADQLFAFALIFIHIYLYFMSIQFKSIHLEHKKCLNLIVLFHLQL